jgi:uncharacterized protein YndB with AHSA1/START domain
VALDPLRYRFRVDCPPEEAFSLWTAGASAWWPMATHSVSGERDARLVFEVRQGGRIYEVLPDGSEYDWGEVLVCEPPHRLVCSWLVGETATELEVRFEGDQAEGTSVDVEHRGWDSFGDEGSDRRERNDGGWSAVLPIYSALCADPRRRITRSI